MTFDDFDPQQRFQDAWDQVKIVRPVHYSLFTFGESELPYYLVSSDRGPAGTVAVTQGEVRITRPLIITPDNIQPEFRNFFESGEDENVIQYLLSRTAAFSHLKFENQSGPARIVTDNPEEAVARLNRLLDDQEEDRVAILTAPRPLAGFAVFRYAAERVWQSAPDNLQELRERGLLP